MAPRELLGKAELTGLIADAQGVYHDLSKGSFDAFSIKHPGAAKHLSTKLFNQPLVKGIADLAEATGINLQNYDSVDLQGAAASMAQHLGMKLGVGGGAAAAVGVAASYAGVEVATGGLAVVGVVIESAIEWAIESFAKKPEEPDVYMRGDWLIIDEGQKTQKRIDNTIKAGMTEMFDDSPDISEMHDFYRVEDFHVGFFVSQGKDEASSTVFDLLTGNTEEHFNVKVRKLPLDRRIALDNDPFASKVRELYFTKTDHVLMDCEVSCDPGTEVLYKGELWNIVSCDGDRALIEARDGTRQTVAMVSLNRARQERAGKQWVYKNGEPAENNSFSVTPGGFGTGDWVWVRRDADWELGMVHIIYGDKVAVYMAQSGFRLDVPVSDIKVATRDSSGLYNRVNDFVRFKMAAIEGRPDDTRRLRLPSKYHSIVREKNPAFRVDPKPFAVELPAFTPAEGARDVENQNRARILDRAEEDQNLHGVRNTVTQEFAAEEEACRRRLMGAGKGGDLCRENDSAPQRPKRFKTETTVEVSGTTGLLVGGAAAVALWYFLA